MTGFDIKYKMPLRPNQIHDLSCVLKLYDEDICSRKYIYFKELILTGQFTGKWSH